MQIIEVSGWTEALHKIGYYLLVISLNGTLEEVVKKFVKRFEYEPKVAFHFGDTYAIVIDPDYRVGKDGE